MINKVRSIASETVDMFRAVARLLWHKLPRIALYSAALFILFSVVSSLSTSLDKRHYQAAPASQFISYTSFTVNNAREGEDISYTVCRQHDRDYNVSGFRTVYVIPDGETSAAKKAFVYNKPISGTVSGANCQGYIVRASEYHFQPNHKYTFTLSLDFQVKYGIMKHLTVNSGIFQIYPQPSGSAGDLQAQITNLQNQLNEIQNSVDSSTGTTGETRTNNTPTSSTTTTNPTPSVTNITNNTTTPGFSDTTGQSSSPTPANTCTVNILFVHALC